MSRVVLVQVGHFPLASPPRDPVDVTQRGVTLNFLTELVHSGVLEASMTIQEVVDCYVRPSTAATRCCLFDVIPERFIGKPRFFVSHTW